jgi:hypothetical protein
LHGKAGLCYASLVKGMGQGTPVSRNRAWLALALLPLLSGCLAAVALPLVAGGSMMAVTKHRVRAATQVPKVSREKGKRAKFYRLTTAGRRALRNEAATWEEYAAAVAKVLRAEPA